MDVYACGFNGLGQIPPYEGFKCPTFHRIHRSVETFNIHVLKTHFIIFSSDKIISYGLMGSQFPVRFPPKYDGTSSKACCTSTAILVHGMHGSSFTWSLKKRSLSSAWEPLRVDLEKIHGICSGGETVAFWTDDAVKVLPGPCLEMPGLRVASVKVGGEHFVLLTVDGLVYTWGEGRRGALGLGDLESCHLPREVTCLAGLKVSKIGAGFWHSIAVTVENDVCVWGWNESGQLGFPCRVVREHEESCDRHSPRFLQSEEKYVGILAEPRFLECLPDDFIVVDICCGDRHTVLLDGDGGLWTWGFNGYGQLGLGHTCPMDEPQRSCLKKILPEAQSSDFGIRAGGWNTCVSPTNVIITLPPCVKPALTEINELGLPVEKGGTWRGGPDGVKRLRKTADAAAAFVTVSQRQTTSAEQLRREGRRDLAVTS
ncbi:unnamed protein product [Notodromas monacha]|uniref:RCC1 domain containing 1 n=1 Tax=Notodromas monacha TaxID=399045 RepID=A0A7R9BJ45_9CRUS|nr:unnamed protein product [Notodromas monacha]CAG0914894.1 unnamed protein product [Notodromas monacha]